MTSRRTGILAKKLGMSRVFENGIDIPVTLLQVEDCQVVSVRTSEKDGYTAIQVGAVNKKAKNVSKPLRGHFGKNKVEPKALVKEFRVSADAVLNAGDALNVTHFKVGQTVDVAGITIGKGFAGVMKRHNFRGLEATHGVSVSHRSHGSTGQRQDPGRVFKNKKMAGHMGQVRAKTQNLKVIAIDEANGLLAIKGSIPGAKGSFVEVTDAIKAVRL
jgi:large subunit ribosomal protein L3